MNDTKPKTTRKKPVNILNDLTASEWIPETISVFVQKGLGAKHQDAQIERQHPAPYSFQDVARLVKFFTKTNQRVLDPFVGIGSTLKACALNNRKGVGIELVPKYVELTKKRLDTELRGLFDNKDQEVIEGNALKVIKQFEDNYFDFIVTSPPYWNILRKKADHKVKETRLANNLDTKYSESKDDLGNIEDYEDFLNVLSNFFKDCGRILKPKKYMCIVVSDFRNKDKYYMFHSDLASKLEKKGFVLKGITVLYQSRKKVYPYGYPYSYVPNIHHQYILILQNAKQ
jgi:DNA modification methylase